MLKDAKTYMEELSQNSSDNQHIMVSFRPTLNPIQM